MDGFGIYTGTRAQYAPQPGLLNVSMDFNAAPNGNARGTEVVIPDNAGPEVRAAAERYNQMVADFARQQGIEDYPVRGVRTRSENQRGVPYTVHTEPFFNTDLEMQRAVEANPAAFAEIYQNAFGGLDNARLIAPHGVGADRGAASEVFGNETDFGMQMARALTGAEAPQGGNMQRQPQGLLSTPTVSTRGQAPAQEEERKPFFQRPGVANAFDTLAMGLEGMTLNPNQALIQGAQQRIQQRREMGQMEQQRNRTVKALEQLGADPQLIQLAESGYADAALKEAIRMRRAGEPRKGVTMGDRLVDPVTGEVIADFSGQGPQYDPEDISKARKEFTSLPAVKEFAEQTSAYSRVISSVDDPSAAGDLSLIFNYMKVLDPGSTVREGEFATAQNAGGVDQRVAGLYNRIMSGERLTPEQRADFADRATRLYQGAEEQYQSVAGQYGEFARSAGLPVEQVIPDFGYSGELYQTPLALRRPPPPSGVDKGQWAQAWSNMTDEERKAFLEDNQ